MTKISWEQNTAYRVRLVPYRSGYAGLLLCLALGAVASPVFSQPQAADTQYDSRLAEQVSRAWSRLRESFLELEISAPDKAITAYRTFYESEGYRDPATSIRITTLVAQLYAQGLGDRARAIQIYDWAIPLYGAFPGGNRLQIERDRLAGTSTGGAVNVPNPLKIKPLNGTQPGAVEPISIGKLASKTEPPSRIDVAAVSVTASHAGGPSSAKAVSTVAPGPSDPVAPPGAAVTMRVPSFGGPGFVPVKSVLAAAPSQLAAASVKTIAFDADKFKLPLLIEQMRGGKVTGESLLKDGTLTADELYVALDTPGMFGEKDTQLRNEMVGLVLKYVPKKLEPVEGLTDNWKFLLGGYYASQKDARAVAVYESLIGQPGVQKRNADIAPMGLGRLSTYYKSTEQPLKAAETQERIPFYTQDIVWASLSLVEAARIYRREGNDDKVQKLYDQVVQQGYGWGTGLMVLERAKGLISEGKLDKARNLLLEPIAGPYADQIKVALLSELSSSYMKTGELNQAREYAEQTLALAGSIELLKNEGLEGPVLDAKLILKWCNRWASHPIITEPIELSFIARDGDKDVPSQRLFVRTLVPVPIKITSNDPRFRCSVIQQSVEQENFAQEEVSVTFTGSPLEQDISTELIVGSSEFPNERAIVPCHVRVQRPIQISGEDLFFGVTKPGMRSTETIRLSADIPFRVLTVTINVRAVEPVFLKEQIQGVHEVKLTFTAPPTGGLFSGNVNITTDMPGQNEIKVPYTAFVE